MAEERTFNEGLDAVLAEMRELMLRKQHDYGPTNIMETPITRLAEAWGIPGIDPKVAGPQLGIYVRLNDKIARLYEGFKNSGETRVVGESLRDTWMDILGYAIIALMVESGTFTDPLVDEPEVSFEEDVPIPTDEEVHRPLLDMDDLPKVRGVRGKDVPANGFDRKLSCGHYLRDLCDCAQGGQRYYHCGHAVGHSPSEDTCRCHPTYTPT